MNLFRKLTAKPWLDPGLDEQLPNENGTAVEIPSARIGLRMFLGVLTVFFSLFVVAYFMRMKSPDWQALSEPSLLWFNTATLAAASVLMQLAKNTARHGNPNSVRGWLTFAGLVTTLFLTGQLIAWQQLIGAGYFAVSNPSYAFFYLLTGLHALHLAGGLWVWSRTTFKVWRGFDGDDLQAVASVRQSIDLCTTYWHYLFLVWLAMFALLLRT